VTAVAAIYMEARAFEAQKYYRRDRPAQARLYRRREGNRLSETKITVIYDNPADPAALRSRL